MKRFVHSFWTKPCENDNEKLKKHVLYFATSLAWLKKNNFPIVLHTDSKGKEIFKDLPYDEIYTTLDNIPEDINPKFYAYGKFLAMENEDLGSIHIDGDVFIKTKELGDKILNSESPCLVQHIEKQEAIRNNYRLWDYPKDVLEGLITDSAYNCGVVKINDSELKKEYFSRYFEMCKKCNKIPFPHSYQVPDLLCEQLLLRNVCKDAETLLPNGTLAEAHQIGYLHIPGSKKFLQDFMYYLERMLKDLDLNLYNICQKI